MIAKTIRCVLSFSLPLLVIAGCMVGPSYHAPQPLEDPAPDSYKETPGHHPGDTAWKIAKPQDAMLRGKWWLVFNDPELNALEDQLEINNQNIKEAFQNFLASRALIGQTRSQLFPTVTVNPTYTKSHSPFGGSVGGGTLTSTGGTGSTGTTGTTTVVGSSSDSGDKITTFASLPFDVSWEPDLWGKIRSAINQATYNTQLSAADLENERLTEESSLAVFFFELRGQDALQKLFDDTIEADRKSLAYTQAQFETGVGAQAAVVEAQTTLQSAIAAGAGVGVERAQFEHAIAVLIGKNPSQFSLPVKPLLTVPPEIPIGVPSQLLERRPDISAAERAMAAANAQIGIEYAAYYPTLVLSADAGFESDALKSLLNWPSRFWSVGPSISYTLFDAGLRKATIEQFVAEYNSDLYAYRQTVLTAFQQVEDSLAGTRILSQQAELQLQAVQAAEKSLELEMGRYQTGIDPYIDVVTVQTTLLSNQQSLVTLRVEAMTSAVQLVAALGGGWDHTQLPTTRQVSQYPTTQETAIQN
jgi:NodT family efflux transporter outer membrane factor (OMF) lipoprotein